jgi:hypothetical protein
MAAWIKSALGIVGCIAILVTAYYLCWALQEWGLAARDTAAAATASAAQERTDEQALTRQAGAFFDQAAVTLQTVNQPCDAKDSHGLALRPGTLCVIQKESEKVAALVVTSQLEERDIAKAAESNMAAFNSVADHVNKGVDALAGTANAATGVIDAASDPEKGITPVLGRAALVENDLDEAVKDARSYMAVDQPPLNKILLDSAVMTDSGAAISKNFVLISNKATKDYLAPWWKKLPGYAGDFADIVAAGARLTR